MLNTTFRFFSFSINQVQIERTIWSKVDDSRVHTVMDLKQFEQTFSAYQRSKEAESGGGLGGTLRRRSVLDRPRELSVVESKRAQNCSIVLSTLKMTNKEVGLLLWINPIVTVF